MAKAKAQSRKRSPVAAEKKDHSYGGISSAAVKKATGKDWVQWCAAIDNAGGAKMDHKQIAAMLHEKFKVKPWWSQMVTVGYEQARGRRIRHQKTDGFEVSASKTFPISASVAYMWWAIKTCRDQWLGDTDIAIHKKTPGKSLRVTWNASTAKPLKSISVGLYPKGKNKTAMAIQHGKLASPAEARRMKKYWATRLRRLKTLVADVS